VYPAQSLAYIMLLVESAHATKYDYEYLIKFKGMSYKHTKWLAATEIGNICLVQWLVFTVNLGLVAIDAMNKKSKSALLRYLNRIDKGEYVAEQVEFDPR
jgi:hypothetical protein